MALRGVLTHRKTRRLARLLNIPQVFALGLLEALWHVTAEQARDGGIGRMSDQDMADEMFYDGDATELVDALVTAGWLEQVAMCRLYVHDWHEHSDDATDNWLARKGQRYANGADPRMRRLSEAEKAKLCARYGFSCGTVRTESHDVALPVPVPEPEPEPVPEPEINTFSSPPAAGECVSEPADPPLEVVIGELVEEVDEGIVPLFPVSPDDPWWDGADVDPLESEVAKAVAKVPRFLKHGVKRDCVARLVRDLRARAPDDEAIRFELEGFTSHYLSSKKYHDGVGTMRNWFTRRLESWERMKRNGTGLVSSKNRFMEGMRGV